MAETKQATKKKETKTSAVKRASTGKYIEALGGRKSATARARIFSDGKGVTVNDKDYKEYFSIERQRAAVIAPLELMSMADGVRVSVRVRGGGLSAQAEAVRNAIAKALVKQDEAAKKQLRSAGFITRDAREVERKKYGLKKARRAPQWKKR